MRALDWNVLMILAGSVGLAAIVVSSGIADWIARTIRTSRQERPLVVIVLAVSTTILTNVTTNAAAASILTPWVSPWPSPKACPRSSSWR